MSRRRRRLSLSSFIPSQIGGLQLWLDAADSSTITESSGSVSAWADKSGNGNDVTQGTGANQPTTGSSTQNGLNVLDFDGGDFCLLPSALYSIPNDDNTIFVVVQHDVTNTNDRIINMEDGGSSRFSVEYSSVGTAVYHNSSTGAAVSASVVETDFSIITGFLSGSTQSVSVNSGAASTNASGATTAVIDAAAIGASGSGAGQFLDGKIAEILIYSRSLSSSELLTVESYLSAKWGIAITVPASLNPVAWFDASDTSTITESGGSVSQWSDISGNSNHATQGTGSAQPSTGTRTINGRNTVDFDGGDFLNLGQPTNLDFTPSTDEFTIVSVVEADAQGTILSKAGSTLTQRQYQHGILTNTGLSVIGGTETDGLIDMLNSPAIFIQTISTSSVDLFVDGVTDVSGTPGAATNSADVLIGARRGTDSNTGSGFFINGAVCELMMFNYALTSAQRESIETYLANKWGISI